MTNSYGSEDEYEAMIVQYAQVIEDEYALDDEYDLERAIDDTLDGMVRNYVEALHVLLYSDSQPDDRWESLMSDSVPDSIESHLVDLAYLTLRADVRKKLRDRDNEINP